MRMLSEQYLMDLDRIVHEDCLGEPKRFFSADIGGVVKYHLQDSICFIDMLAVREVGRGNGVRLYSEWERLLPNEVVAIALMCIDSQEVRNFWRKVGFTNLYQPSGDLDDEVPPVLVKAIDPRILLREIPYQVEEKSSKIFFRP